MPGEPQNHLSLAGKYSNCDIWNFVLRQTLSGQVRPRMPRKPCHPFASQPGSAKLQCKMHPRADRIRTGWRKHVGLGQVLEWDCPERPFLCETHWAGRSKWIWHRCANLQKSVFFWIVFFRPAEVQISLNLLPNLRDVSYLASTRKQGTPHCSMRPKVMHRRARHPLIPILGSCLIIFRVRSKRPNFASMWLQIARCLILSLYTKAGHASL